MMSSPLQTRTRASNGNHPHHMAPIKVNRVLSLLHYFSCFLIRLTSLFSLSCFLTHPAILFFSRFPLDCDVFSRSPPYPFLFHSVSDS